MENLWKINTFDEEPIKNKLNLRMENWLNNELSYIELGDKRLNQRFGKLLRQLSQMPCSSIPEACGSKASTKAAYRFFDAERVAVKDIREGFFRATDERAKEYPQILVVQDTTDLDFSAHTSTRGLGYLDNRWCQGLKVHSALAISPDGVPLGLVDQQVWARDGKEYGKKHACRKKKTSEKESQRWLTGVTKAERHVEEGVLLVTIADREADMYDLFKQKRRRGHDLLIRATHNRALRDEPKLLYEKVVEAPLRGETAITIRRGRERKGRQAQIIVHWAAVEIQPPAHRVKEHLPFIRLNAIVAEEIHAPNGIAPVRWLLLTTCGVENFEDALQCVRWYTMRWLIERYHYTLKSGCQVEELQLEEAERIERAVAVYCIVAWRILFLTYLARLHPDQLSTTVLDKEEVEALSCFIRKSKEPLEKFPTIEEAVRMIAHLGGFLGRKGDGFPGVKVLWRGLKRLNDFFIAYQIFKDVGNA